MLLFRLAQLLTPRLPDALAVNLSFRSVPNYLSIKLFFLSGLITDIGLGQRQLELHPTRSWSKPSFRARFRLLLTPRYYTVDDQGPPPSVHGVESALRAVPSSCASMQLGEK